MKLQTNLYICISKERETNHLKNKTMKTTEKNYKAFIAGTRWSVPFDYAYGKTKSTAIAAVKRKNSPDWKDCCIWCAYVHENGALETL